MSDSENDKINRLQQLGSEMASVNQDLVKVEGAGLPTVELEQRAAALFLELIELDIDLTPLEKASIRKQFEVHGVGKVLKDLGKLYNT